MKYSRVALIVAIVVVFLVVLLALFLAGVFGRDPPANLIVTNGTTGDVVVSVSKGPFLQFALGPGQSQQVANPSYGNGLGVITATAIVEAIEQLAQHTVQLVDNTIYIYIAGSGTDARLCIDSESGTDCALPQQGTTQYITY